MKTPLFTFQLLAKSSFAGVAWLCLLVPALADDGQPRDGPGSRTQTVMTADGPVVGVQRAGLNWFLGIPYAAPPTGERRWRPPESPQKWLEPREATEFGNWCMQVAPAGFSKPILNEDCLYLNVVTPRDAPRHHKQRAVMVWIHGGGLRQGRANDYDPTMLVEHGGVVFVSFNYRLNILGFLAHPALDGEGHDFANYGLMDQQFALAWVRRNIGNFGGDPDNVTLVGESSGGANVFNHLVSPKSVDLFDKAIIESGSIWYGDFAPFYNGLTLASAEKVGGTAAAMLGCTGDSDASCLRAAPIEKLADVLRKIPTYSFGVVLDGTVMKESTRDAIASGRFKRVPVINGSNHDEWTWVEGLSEFAAGHPLTEDELQHHLEATFGATAHEVVPHYPVSAFNGSAGAASARAVTDGLFVCPMLALNRTLAGYTKVWGYEFSDSRAPFPFHEASFPYGAAHTLEMRYLFKDYTGAVGELKPLSADQRALSDTMVSYWTTFARTGNPNSSGTRHWPALGKDPVYLSLLPPGPRPISSATIDAEHRCSTVWQVPAAQRGK